ncbi:MAG: acyl-ACP--UDP-N-acetylglucosamine O-acyltransferase [Longimicrobiales bacterium]
MRTTEEIVEARGDQGVVIHSTAIVSSDAVLGTNVRIGPYSLIGPAVTVGDGTEIGPHVLVERHTRIGAGCVIHKGAVLGTDPQDLKFDGEDTLLVVGDRTVVREYATLNRGTRARGRTDVGSECLLMAYVHIAHDCIIGDHVILSNSVNMGGHVQIGDWAIVGGLTAIHQFVRIGQHAFVGGASRVQKDIPPYVRAAGSPLELHGLNSVGMQRRGISAEVRAELKRAYRILFRSGLNVRQALTRAEMELRPLDEVRHFLDFIRDSERGIAL